MVIANEPPVVNHLSRRKRPADHKQPAPVVVQFQSVQPSGQPPKASRRLQWLSLAEDGEYADHQILARIRYHDSINELFGSGEYDKYKEGLRAVVEEHNGWIDPDTDEPMPPASDDSFWASLAQEEVYLMLRAVNAARKKVFAGLLGTNDS